MIICSKNKDGSIRFVDIYDQHTKKIQVRPIAGRYQLQIAPNYKAQFNQNMINESFNGELAILDSKSKRSIVVHGPNDT